MKPSHLILLALAATAILGCQEGTTQPGQDTPVPASSARGAATRESISASAPVHFHPRTGRVSTSQTVSGNANVHQKFSSIEEACLEFAFSGDLLDLGDFPLRWMVRMPAGS